MIKPKQSKKYFIAPGISAEACQQWLSAQPPDRQKLTEMVRRRFEARFIEPVSEKDQINGGFAALALSCLAIQALQSFRSGAAASETASDIRKFIRDNDEFTVLRGREQKFYDNVRNALLHQAQTDGGWRINLSGPVYDPKSNSIGAQSFFAGFRAALNRYCVELAESKDEDGIWKGFLRKISHILKTCDSEEGKTNSPDHAIVSSN